MASDLGNPDHLALGNRVENEILTDVNLRSLSEADFIVQVGPTGEPRIGDVASRRPAEVPAQSATPSMVS